VTGEIFGPAYDYATIKYNSAGQQLWIRRYDNVPLNQDDSARAIALDGLGNIYVTGWSGSDTALDYATVKYNPTGQEWVARYNGPANNNDGANAIAVDGSGNVYVTGFSAGVGRSL
jgi:Beta-propeller repeat